MSAIETLDDWNAILTGCLCCPMPACPVPVLECESLFGAGFLTGYGGTWGFNEGDTYLKTRYSYYNGGWILYTQSGAIRADLGDKDLMDEITVEVTSGGRLTGGITSTTYEGAVSVATARTDSYGAMTGALDFTDEDLNKGSNCEAYREHRIPWHGAGAYLSFACLMVMFVRYRWKIPTTFTGIYFKITWDEVFFPVAYDPQDPESEQPTAINRDLTVTWEGPGDPEDEATWLASAWRSIDPPEQPGESRIVNIRFECYRSPDFGNKPQVTGEAFDYPPPPDP